MIGNTITLATRNISHVCSGRRKNRHDWLRYDDSDNDKNNNDRHIKNVNTSNSYMLFESKHVPLKGNPICIQDVRDAVECCSGIMDERMKNECYVQFGVDGEMAEKYYKHIDRMERQYEMPDDPIPTRDIQLKTKKKNRKWFIFGKDDE